MPVAVRQLWILKGRKKKKEEEDYLTGLFYQISKDQKNEKKRLIRDRMLGMLRM